MNAREALMSDRKQPPKTKVARETRGEGVPERKRKEGTPSAEQRADPQRGNEVADARLIERRRDARNPDGI
jgi:hypothetical protein